MFLSLNHTIQLEWSECKEILPKFWWFHLFLSFPNSFKRTGCSSRKAEERLKVEHEKKLQVMRCADGFYHLGGGLFQIFVYVHPLNWGRCSPILTNIFFQMGWFNHQLVILLLTYLIKFHRKCENRVEVGNVLYYFAMFLWLLYGCF